MAVLVEAISVIIRRTTIEEKFPGRWEAFVKDVKNSTLCSDGELARVGFMSPDDVSWYVNHLAQFGFQYLEQDKATDLVVAEQRHGLLKECDWAECGYVNPENDPKKRIDFCRLKGSKNDAISTPEGWEYERSLSASCVIIPTDQEEGFMGALVKAGGGTRYIIQGDIDIRGQRLYTGKYPRN